jgi:hypothetical protein
MLAISILEWRNVVLPPTSYTNFLFFVLVKALSKICSCD